MNDSAVLIMREIIKRITQSDFQIAALFRASSSFKPNGVDVKSQACLPNVLSAYLHCHCSCATNGPCDKIHKAAASQQLHKIDQVHVKTEEQNKKKSTLNVSLVIVTHKTPTFSFWMALFFFLSAAL